MQTIFKRLRILHFHELKCCSWKAGFYIYLSFSVIQQVIKRQEIPSKKELFNPSWKSAFLSLSFPGQKKMESFPFPFLKKGKLSGKRKGSFPFWAPLRMTSISIHFLKQMVSIDNYKKDNFFPVINKWIINNQST